MSEAGEKGDGVTESNGGPGEGARGSRMNEVDQDRATCFHEAAHAVFALRVCGGWVRHVDADEAFCASGVPNYGGEADRWREAMYTLAGRFAEQVDAWGETRSEPWDYLAEAHELGDLEPGSDAHGVAECFARADDPGEEYRAAVEDAKETVRELWPEITAVAEALRERRRLDGAEVARIIQREETV